MGKVCTFFGHRICPIAIKTILKDVLTEMINSGVCEFYVGEQGNFDSYSYNVLKELKKEYPQISYAVVRAYLPIEKKEKVDDDYLDKIFPDELSKVPKKYAISHRNLWMLKRTDIVLTYVTHLSGGGASDFKELAIKRGKTVIELSDYTK